MNNFTYSKNGLALTERFEGVRLQAYQDQVGVWTIGYGHTGPVTLSGSVFPITAGLTITQEQAEALLASDTAFASSEVNRLVTYQITQPEFDSLVDFVFNVGSHALAGSSLLRYLNAGQIAEAAKQFEVWDHAGGKEVAGLLRRRIAEEQEFTTAT